jgi:prepilin-type processing-associated H-X9-DG protein
MFVCPAAGDCESVFPAETSVNGAFLMWGNPEGSPPQYSSPPPQSVLAPVQRRVYWSYVINSKLDNSPGDKGPEWAVFVNAEKLEPRKLIVLLVEKCMNPGDTMPGYAEQSLARGKTTWTRFTTRHYGGGNLLFLDGHVAYLKASALAPPRGHGYYKGEKADALFERNPAYNIPDVVVWDPNQSPLFP